MVILEHPARERPPIRIALTGANGGYGRTLLAQLDSTPEIRASVLVDPDLAGVRSMLRELGIDDARIVESTTASATASAVAAGRICVVPGIDAIDWDSLDVLVEASGRIAAGHDYATSALAHGTHVVMVSKEVDSVVGIALHDQARRAGLSYLTGDGDQPANLLRMLDWVAAVGFDVVAVGKSGEYDLVFDPAAGTITQVDQTIDAAAMADLLELGDDVRTTLSARADLVAGLKRAAAADACEMLVVATRTGTHADVDTMHYPVARIDELADIYASVDDGGILGRDGAIDVFSALRLPGEASFAGGVFAVVRTGDATTWDVLRGKGHVVSRSGDYACLYWPYHYMGVETPLTIHAAVDGVVGRAPRWTTMLAARASTDLPAGTTFSVAGHHHEIAGTAPVIVAPDEAASPYYLLDGARLTRDIVAGELIPLDAIDGVAPGPLAAHRAGIALTLENGAHR